MRYPLLVRIAVVALIGAGLVFPLSLIKGKVSERRERADAVQKSFVAEAGGAQVVAGPFLTLCEPPAVDGGSVSCATRVVAPRFVEVKGTLSVEQRYRGIYPVRLYRGELTFSGEFEVPPDDAASRWRVAYLTVAVSDPRGIKNASIVAAGATRTRFAPGARGGALSSGLHARLGALQALGKDGPMPFRFTVEFTGTSRLEIAPVGDSSDIQLASKWSHPSLIGAFVADEREVSAAGFAARWRINEFATGGAAYWREFAAGGQASAGPRAVGVSLVEPINIYSLSYRAIEYGFLFVLFTFVAFVLVELVCGVTLHPVQYAFVGLALAVFFLLLVALSEHIDFASAYLAAALACVTLLTYYLRHPLETWLRTSAFAALFSALYGSLYFLLKSEDHALLLGSLLVFAALATAMLLTRRLDWNALSRRLAPQAG